MRVLSLLCLLLAALAGCATSAREPAFAEPTTRPFLWRVDGPGRSAPFFVYGTRHSADVRIVTLPEVVAEALIASDEVVTETGTLVDRLLDELEPGSRLSDTIGRARVERAARRLGVTAALLERVPAESVAVSLALSNGRRRPATLVLDDYVIAIAQRLGKTVAALETMEEVLPVVHRLRGVISSQLVQIHGDLPTAIDELLSRPGDDDAVEEYLEGDLEAQEVSALAFRSVMSERLDPTLAERLLDDRDRLFAERIAARVRARPGAVMFFAFGCAHLPGSGGVLARLEEAGFEATRLDGGDDPFGR